MAFMTLSAGFTEWMRKNKRSVRPCNCGWPLSGTAHSPDCFRIVDENEAWADYVEERAEKRSAAEHKG